MQQICLLLASLAWLGLLGVTDHYLPWVSWHGEAMVGVATFFLWLAWAFCKAGRKVVVIPRVALVFLAVGGLATTQALCGQLLFWSDALMLWLYLGLMILALCLGFDSVGTVYRKHGDIECFSTLLLITGFVLSIQVMIRALDLDFMSHWVAGINAKRRPGSNLSQPNHLATMLNWAVVCTAYLYFRTRIRSMHFYLALSVLALGLVVSESRTGMLSFVFISAALLLGWGGGQTPRPRGLLLFLPVTLVAFFAWPQIWSFIQLTGVTEASVNLGSSGRLDLWHLALKAIAQQPWLGWGYRQSSWAYISALGDIDSALIATYAHNLALDLWLWFGLPVGSLLLLALVGWVWRHTLLAKTLEQRMLALYLLPFGLHAMLEFPYAYLYFLVPVALCIGGIAALADVGSGIRVPAKVFHGLCGLMFGVALWSAYEYLLLEEDFRLARFASARVGTDPSGYERSQAHVLPQVSALIDVVRLVPSENMTERDIDSAHRVALTYPWLATLSKYALILKLNGRDTEYEDCLRVIRIYFGEGGVSRVRERLDVLRKDNEEKLVD